MRKTPSGDLLLAEGNCKAKRHRCQLWSGGELPLKWDLLTPGRHCKKYLRCAAKKAAGLRLYRQKSFYGPAGP